MLFDTWYGCYTAQLGKHLPAEAFEHPAKMAWGLAQRIMEHLGKAWPRITTVLDPMAGVGIVPLAAAYAGYQALAGELEQHFANKISGWTCPAALQEGWHAYWAQSMRGSRAYHLCGACQSWLKTDKASQAHEKVPSVDLFGHPISSFDGSRIIASRPAHRAKGLIDLHRTKLQRQGKPVPLVWRHDAKHVPLRSAEAIVSSPPYANQVHHGNGIDAEKLTGNPAGRNTQAKAQGYGHHPQQIGQLGVVSSPPFSPGDGQPQTDQTNKGKIKRADQVKAKYGHHPQQIGQLGVVSSPPYGDSSQNYKAGWQTIDRAKAVHQSAREQKTNRQGTAEYGHHPQQLGNAPLRDYWAAMRACYLEYARILASGSPLILVLKGYIKDKEYVDLPAQTAALLEQCGFEIVHWHEASLYAREAQPELFAGYGRDKAPEVEQVDQHSFLGPLQGEQIGRVIDAETRFGRVGFFRRVWEQNNPGGHRIGAEVVLCAERQ